MTPMHDHPVDEIVEAAMQEGSIPGLALAVVQGGRLTLAKAYGLANMEHQVPATTHTVFRIASITKTFTATAVMMLVERGKVSLDDPISQYLSDSPDAWSAITVRHLLSHTSGIKSYEATFSASWQPGDRYDKIIGLVAGLPLGFQPGEGWGYCNTNYLLLGLLIEHVSGQSYRDFLREQILEPLGMTETRLNDAGEIVPNRAQGYAWDSETLNHPGRPPLRNREKPPGLWDHADGGVLSTVLDLARWDAALYTERLLSRATLEQMWTPARLNDGQTIEYGLGWIVKVVHGHRTVGHWGRNPGFIAEMTRFIDDQLTLILLCNRWKADLARLGIKIADFYLPGIAPRPSNLLSAAAPQQGGTSMWLPLTERARRTILAAQQEVYRMGENYLSTRHLLLGLLSDPGVELPSVAARILEERLGVPLEQIRSELNRQDMALPDDPDDARAVPSDLEAAITPAPFGPARSGGGEEDNWARGLLEVSQNGWGFLRRGDLPPIYVSQAQIRRFTLKEGDWVSGKVRPPREDEKYYGLLRVETVNDMEPDQNRERRAFDDRAPRELTPRSKRVLNFANEEARQLHQHTIGTEHLLLGLIREREGIAGRVLAGLSLELDHLRSLVLDLYQSPE
jgi:CubicO group peptidase (beta-lactamase class C family)